MNEALVTPSASTCSNELYNLILRKRWHFAEKHLQRCPQDAFYRDPIHGTTPLAMACRLKPSARFVKLLLTVHPLAATVTTCDTGSLPLHYACRYNASLDVLRVLVADHPETAALTTTTNKGNTSSYQTPVAELWQGRNTNETTVNCSTIFWQKMELLLRCIAKSRGDETLLLHAAASIQNTPKQVWDYVLNQYSDQACLRDTTGRLPLHYAALADVDIEYCETAIADKYRPRQDQVLYRVLQIYPQAAQIKDPNEHGRWVLHTAVLHGHVWHSGVKELLEAAPDATLYPDPVSGLLPCQLSQDLNTIYRLVRIHPSVMEAQLKPSSSSSLILEAHKGNCSLRSAKGNKPDPQLNSSMPNLYQSHGAFDITTNFDKIDQRLPHLFGEQLKVASSRQVLTEVTNTLSNLSNTKSITLEKFMAKERKQLKKKRTKKVVE
jgi:hypothetical protein